MSSSTKLGLVAGRALENSHNSQGSGVRPDPAIINPERAARIRSAKLAVRRLFDLLPPLDVGDPEAFIAGAVAILAEFPPEVMECAVHPVHGIPKRTDRPTLKMIHDSCAEHYARIERDETRRRVREEIESSREPPRKPRTPGQQAAIDAQVAAIRQQLGIPEGGLQRRGVQAPPMRHDPERTKMLLAELAARKARNE